MIENIINIITIVSSFVLAVSIIFNLIEARKRKDSNKVQSARIQLIILLVIYVIYGFLRNLV